MVQSRLWFQNLLRRRVESPHPRPSLTPSLAQALHRLRRRPPSNSSLLCSPVPMSLTRAPCRACSSRSNRPSSASMATARTTRGPATEPFTSTAPEPSSMSSVNFSYVCMRRYTPSGDSSSAISDFEIPSRVFESLSTFEPIKCAALRASFGSSKSCSSYSTGERTGSTGGTG